MKIVFAAKGHEYLIEALSELGEVIVFDSENDNDFGSEADVLIVASSPMVDLTLLEKFPSLKALVRVGSGFDNIDIDALKERNIKFIRVPEGNRDSVAEHTLLLITGLLRKINKAIVKGFEKPWDREGVVGNELKGKVVGIVGYGNVGWEVAQRLVSLGCIVNTWDPYRKFNPVPGVGNVPYEELLALSDIISFHIQDVNNGYLFDFDHLEKVKRGVLIVNTSRGNVVNTRALIQGLRSGVIGGLAIDVIEGEPNSQFIDELKTFDNVIATPHVAGHSYEAYEKMKELVVRKIKYTLSNLML
ncbi:MAG: hypothetical protein GXO48_06910 [Chlorobi bacterium]|nr:hypothetical protein [Chlorobiota bacterium]